MAFEIVHYRQKTMQSNGALVPDCKSYLSQFFTNKTTPLMVHMLVRSPSPYLVEAALGSLIKNSALGADGI